MPDDCLATLRAALPTGLSARPLDPSESGAVFELMAAAERHDLGVVEIEEADLVADWGRPSFDLAASSVGVYDGEGPDERLVAYAELSSATRADAAVHPEHRRRGIGTALAAWVRGTARARGGTIVGSPVPQGSDGDRLLERLGYFVRWESWVLELPEGAEIAQRPLPEGYAIRTAESDAERRAAWTVQEDAFLEWAEREREPYDDYLAEVVGRPGFEPWHLRVVTDATGEVVATCHLVVSPQEGRTTAFVQSLATRADQRGRGLAQAMLADAFGNARERAGAVSSELNTDTRTGALGLYERVGMRVRQTWLHRAIHVTEEEAT